MFHKKLENLLYNLRNGKYFGQKHKIVYEIRVIEYQQRGLPHCHLVVMLSDIPDWRDEKEQLSMWIDENINANFPVIVDTSSDRLKRINDLISSHMVHKCYKGETGCLDEKTGQCTRGFTSNIIQSTTTLDERGTHTTRETQKKI